MENQNQIEFYNSNIVSEFLEVLENRGFSASTLKNYKSVLNRYNEHLAALEVPHYDILSRHVYKYLHNLDEDYSGNTVNLHLSAIRSLYTYMCNIGALEVNPVNNMMYRRVDRTMPPYVGKDERKMFYKYLRNHTYGDIELGAKIMFSAGLRIGEVGRLDLMKDIENRNGKLYLHVRKAKGKKPRIVPVFSEQTSEDILKFRMLYYNIDDYLLHIRKHSYQYHTKRFEELTGVYVTPHIMRYSFATDRARDGLPINTIRLLLGHESLNTTLRYIAVAEEEIYNLI